MLLLPDCCLLASLLQHPLAYRDDQPEILGERYEFDGRHHTALGCSQRTNASTSAIRPVSSCTTGW